MRLHEAVPVPVWLSGLDSSTVQCHDNRMADDLYSLADLARLADVTPRTVRYYVAQGLLPSPEAAGPATRYGEGHLARLRLIRRLQRDHLPLAEIRLRLERMGDDEVIATVSALSPQAPAPSQEPGDTLAFVRSLMTRSGVRPTVPGGGSHGGALLRRLAVAETRDEGPEGAASGRLREVAPAARVAQPLAAEPAPSAAPAPAPATPSAHARGCRTSGRTGTDRGPLHLGAPRHHPGRGAPCPPPTGPDREQARGPAGADRPGAVRGRLATAVTIGPLIPRAGHALRPAPSGPRPAIEKEAPRDPSADPPARRPPGQCAPQRPPRPAAHPGEWPQPAVPRHRRHGAHGPDGSRSTSSTREPRVRPGPVRVHGRAQQARAWPSRRSSKRSIALIPPTGSRS